MAYNPINPNGQATMANSSPVVIASNQSPVSVVGVVSVIGTVPVTQSGAWNTSVSGTIGASIIGLPPVAVTNTPSISGTMLVGGISSVEGTIGASIISVGINNQADGGSAVLQLNVAGFNRVYNGSNWDRVRGNSSIGTLMSTGASSVITAQAGTRITSVSGTLEVNSIVGTYAEDAASATADKGLFVLGVRNDTLTSMTSADLDYSSHIVGPAGEMITANSPITKWVSGTASMLGGLPVTGSLVPIIAAQGSSIFTYVTGIQIANASGNNAWITLLGGTNSVIGYTVAPANGGSNILYSNALKTNANAIFSASISAVASVYLSAQGFISKT